MDPAGTQAAQGLIKERALLSHGARMLLSAREERRDYYYFAALSF